MWTFGIDSPYELVKKSSAFILKEIASNIRCPTLVLDKKKMILFQDNLREYMMPLHVQKKYSIYNR